MANLKKGLSGLRALPLAAKAERLVEKMTGNLNFPTPVPELAVIITAKDELLALTAIAAYGDKIAIANREAKRAELSAMLYELAFYVSMTSGGDETKIISSGFEVAKTPSPVPPLSNPKDMRAKRTNISGEIELNWRSVTNALNYDVEMAIDNSSTGELVWTKISTTSKSRLLVQNLERTVQYVFRTKAIGRRSESGYSDIVVIMAL